MRILILIFAVCTVIAVINPAQSADSNVNPFACSTPPKRSSSSQDLPGASASGVPATAPVRSIFDEIGDCHFSLRATVNDDQQDASFSYGHDGAQHVDGLKSQFAFGYRSAPLGQFNSRPAPFLLLDVDGNLSTGSQKSKSTSTLNVRPEFGWRITSLRGPDPINGDITSEQSLFFRFGPMLETTQDYAVRNYLTELAITATRDGRDGLVIGRYKAVGATGISMRFRPYLSFYAGTNLHGVSASGELTRTRFRVVPQPIIEFALDRPEKLGLDSVILQVVDTFYYLPLEGQTKIIGKSILESHKTNNQFSASLQFGIGKDFSFGPTLTTGAVAPLFKRDTTFTVGLKLGFGQGGGEAAPIKSSF